MTDPLLDMVARLQSEGFTRTGPVAAALSAPIADTPVVVTLDELRPYELNPRITKNPLHEEIKASIRERGLDAPPPITQRPGADHYIIRNGGNTRLAKARERYEAEDGKPISQAELARRLKAAGYPVPQPHISRMREAVEYLLPATPLRSMSFRRKIPPCPPARQ
jgi:hypothetical protein